MTPNDSSVSPKAVPRPPTSKVEFTPVADSDVAALKNPGEEWRILPRILVVDDEPTVVDVFNEFLAAQGYEVTVVSNGEDAVRMIPSLRPDIILTDINLPGLSGLEVMRHARAHDPEVAVIVVTGYASAATAIDALRQGAYDYVTKPFDLDEVHQIVERGIANRRLKAINRQLVEELREKNAILERHELELRERVQLATRQMTTLYEVGKEISANLELEPRLSLVASRSAEQIGAPAAVVYLRQPELEEFTPAAVHGFEWSVREVNAGNVIPLDGVLAPAAYDQQTVRLSPPPNSDSIAVPGLPGVRCRTLLALPLVSEGKTIGVLAVCDKVEDFSPEDESFLTLFASQAAIAILNSQLFEHTKSLDKLKSDFVAVVSHEIRTPLTSVKGAVELLGDPAYFKNTEQQQKLLAIAHANSDRLLVLINDILDFSKLESSSLPMNLERQQLEPVVQEAAHSMRTQLEERGIQLSVELPSELPDLHIDAGRVTQVITNLLSNAIKFSPQGGAIHISAALWEGAVRVSVRDHGEGIAPQNLPKLFRKFSQIDPSATRRAGGAGLGLVICKGIVEQHGGRIWVESAPGEGSIFHFTLPLEERPAPELAQS
jgi:DNA-binding response OmpR family regulator/nitrogen-specific signal transduction histidine kinase